MDYRNDYSAISSGSVLLRGGTSSTAASVSPPVTSHAGLFYYSEGMAMKPPSDLSSVAASKTSAGSSRTSVAVPPVPHAGHSTSASGSGAPAGGSSAKSSSSSFAAALRQLAKQAGVPTSQVNNESVASRGSSSASSASSPRESRASHASASGDPNPKPSGLPVTRTRSPPPVVTIAPTLSFSAAHYQESRKTQGYDRQGHLHSLPAAGSFNGGISTGLSGLPAVNLSLPATNSVPLDYLRAHPELQTSAVSPYGHLGALRPEELLYTGLRNSLPASTTPVATPRPEEGNFHLLPPSLNSASPHHDSLWVSSRASAFIPGRSAPDYLLGSRAAPYLPYRTDLIQQAVLEQSALVGQVHPALYQHSMAAAAQHTLRLEEQLYLERCGLLRSPSLMIPPQGYPLFAYPPSPYLGYRYSNPLVPPSESAPISELNLSRANSEEDKKEKEKNKEELAAAAVVSPTMKYPAVETSALTSRVISPPVASAFPRKDREKSKENRERRKDRESRKGTISLPSESSVRNQAKIQAVPPLNVNTQQQVDTRLVVSSSPVQLLPRCEDDENQNAAVSAQFSQSALEAMAMLQRNAVEDKPQESCESPLDLSEPVKEVVVPTFRPPSPEEPVVSLLDLREQHYRERDQENDSNDEDEARDVECNATIPLRLRYQLNGESRQREKSAEGQLQFLQMFDLVTHSHIEDIMLHNCERRHQILRETTPEPAEPETLEEGACSRLRYNSPKTSLFQVDSGKREFFLQLGMEVSSESQKRIVESSWSLIKADRLRRCCSPCRVKRTAGKDSEPVERPVVKVPRLAVSPEKKRTDWPELQQSTNVSEESDQNKVSKLATEATFWLRHLTVPLARALTPLNPTSLPSHKEASETRPEPELADKWSRLETVMSMYISYNQEISTEIEFLKQHCEKLHLQLAEGQASLSRLCLTLSSLLDKQRQIENDRQSLLEGANRLQEIMTSLQVQ